MSAEIPLDGELAGLLERWHAGWVAARGYRTTRADARSITALIGDPGREEEHIALTGSAAYHEALARRVACRPGHRLTLPTRDRAATVRLVGEAGYAVRTPEWLMTRPLAGHPRVSPPPGYEVVWSARGDAVVAEVVTPGGLAAKGQIGVTGTDAAVDRIFTMPAHRRRGLGQVVMGALVAAAVDRGARTGLLIASVDGHGLYTSLGWHSVVEIVTAGHPSDMRQEAAVRRESVVTPRTEADPGSVCADR